MVGLNYCYLLICKKKKKLNIDIPTRLVFNNKATILNGKKI